MNYVCRQLISNGFLVAVALASVVGAGVSLRGSKQGASAQSDQPLLPRLLSEEPDFLALARGAQEVRLDNRTGGKGAWVAQSPVNSLGDSTAINAVIDALRGIRVIRRIERAPRDAPNDLLNFGLRPPRFVWHLGVGANEWTLSFGNQASGFRGGTYLTLSGSLKEPDAVYVVEVNSAALDLIPEQVIDSRLIHANHSEVRELFFNSKLIQLHARQDEDGDHWFEVEEPHLRLENAKFAHLLNELGSLKGTHFTNVPQFALKGDNPSAVLRLVLPSREINVEFLGPCTDAPGLTLARVSGGGMTWACADFSSLLATLSQPADTWRDTRLFTLRTDQVESVRTSLRGKRAELRREGTAFTMESASTFAVDLRAGNEFVTALLATRGQVVSVKTPAARTVFDSGDYVLIRSSVVGKQEEYQEKIFMGPATASGDRLVKRTQDSAVLSISEATAALLQMDTHSFERD